MWRKTKRNNSRSERTHCFHAVDQSIYHVTSANDKEENIILSKERETIGQKFDNNKTIITCEVYKYIGKNFSRIL